MKINRILLSLVGALSSTIVFADSKVTESTIGDVATNISNSLGGITELIIGISVVAGLAFGVAAIFKFKQHRDNPQQVPLGQPLALLAIAVMLLWLQFLLQATGRTMAQGDTETGQGKLQETPKWLEGGS